MLATAIAILLTSGQAQAAQIDASLIPEYDAGVGTFTGEKFVQISYEPGSALSKLFDGRVDRLDFVLDGEDTAKLISKVNSALIKSQSPTLVSGANVTYTGVLKGSASSVTISYKVVLVQKFSGFKLDKTVNDNIPIDVNWRGFLVEGPLLAKSPAGKAVNINQPIGLLEAVLPEFAAKIMDIRAKPIMTEPIIDFREIGEMKLDRWHFLFDPTKSQVTSGGLLGGDTGRAKVLSVYSLGECSIREGCPPPKENDATVSIDGSQAKIHISTPHPNSQIEVAGFTSIEQAGDSQILRVRMDNPNPIVAGFPIQVLLVLGGMMGAIAVFVLVKSKK
jgi:hypothetical protein